MIGADKCKKLKVSEKRENNEEIDGEPPDKISIPTSFLTVLIEELKNDDIQLSQGSQRPLISSMITTSSTKDPKNGSRFEERILRSPEGGFSREVKSPSWSKDSESEQTKKMSSSSLRVFTDAKSVSTSPSVSNSEPKLAAKDVAAASEIQPTSEDKQVHQQNEGCLTNADVVMEDPVFVLNNFIMPLPLLSKVNNSCDSKTPLLNSLVISPSYTIINSKTSIDPQVAHILGCGESELYKNANTMFSTFSHQLFVKIPLTPIYMNSTLLQELETILTMFSILGPTCPNDLKKGEPRAVRWHKVNSETDHAGFEFIMSTLESKANFRWRPYVDDLKNWCFVSLYKENEQFVVDDGSYCDLAEELRCFGVCLCADKIFGLDGVEKYMPYRVAMQFGMDQDVPHSEFSVMSLTCIGNFNRYVQAKCYKPCVLLEYHNWWKKLKVDVLRDNKQKRHRDGYEDGITTLRNVSSAASFIWLDAPLEILGSVTSISFTDLANLQIKDNKLTTEEVKSMCEDLRVLGKQDFKHLLKWRIHIRNALSSSKKTEPASTAVVENENEVDEDDRLLNKMEELTNSLDRKKKHEKKILAKRRAKDKVRKAIGMLTSVLMGMIRTIESLNARLNRTKTNNPGFIFGVSYPGALSAWFRLKFLHLTCGSIASSAVVLAVYNFTKFDQQIGESAGVKCKAALQETSRLIEQKLATNGKALKASFNAADFEIDGDFLYFVADAAVTASQYGNPDILCKPLVEAKKHEDDLVEAYAKFIKDFFLKSEGSTESYNQQNLKNTAINENSADRLWWFQVCTEVAYFQVAPSNDSIRSYKVYTRYDLDLCKNVFGKGIYPDVDATNLYYGGTKIAGSKIVFTNDSQDPWRRASKQISSPDMPSYTITCHNCGHGTDMRGCPQSPFNIEGNDKNCNVINNRYLNCFK